jgi:hypothetical protein
MKLHIYFLEQTTLNIFKIDFFEREVCPKPFSHVKKYSYEKTPVKLGHCIKKIMYALQSFRRFQKTCKNVLGKIRKVKTNLQYNLMVLLVSLK